MLGRFLCLLIISTPFRYFQWNVLEAKSGDTFELPEHSTESIETVWKLLKVSVGDDGSRWGVYIAAQEALAVDSDDFLHLSPYKPFALVKSEDYYQRVFFSNLDSYDVEIAPLASIESWIKQSTILRETIISNPNLRRSTRARNKPQ